jgi:hypothetical protein
MTIIDKLTQVNTILQEINEEDPAIGSIFIDGFGIALNTTQMLLNKGDRTDFDISEYLLMVSRALGVSVEDMMMHVIQKHTTTSEVLKTPDAETMEFITSGLDDYEKFIAENKAKDDLSFLKENI